MVCYSNGDWNNGLCILVCYSNSDLNRGQFVYYFLARQVIGNGDLNNGWSEYQTYKSPLLRYFCYSDPHFENS